MANVHPNEMWISTEAHSHLFYLFATTVPFWKNVNYSRHQSFLVFRRYYLFGRLTIYRLLLFLCFSLTVRKHFDNDDSDESLLSQSTLSFVSTCKIKRRINKRYVKLNIQGMKAPRRSEAEKNSWHDRLYSTVYARRRNALIPTRATHVCRRQQTGVR